MLVSTTLAGVNRKLKCFGFDYKQEIFYLRLSLSVLDKEAVSSWAHVTVAINEIIIVLITSSNLRLC